MNLLERPTGTGEFTACICGAHLLNLNPTRAECAPETSTGVDFARHEFAPEAPSHRPDHRCRCRPVHVRVVPGPVRLRVRRGVRRHPQGVRQRPCRREAGLLHHDPHADRLWRVGRLVPGEELGARSARQPPHHPEERQASRRRLPRRRLHANPAARTGCRRHARHDLLRLLDSARCHHRARGQPPAADRPEVPAWQRVSRLRLHRR